RQNSREEKRVEGTVDLRGMQRKCRWCGRIEKASMDEFLPGHAAGGKHDAPRLLAAVAVTAAVEQAADPPESFANKHGGHDDIRQLQGLEVVLPAEPEERRRATQQRSVQDDSALGKVDRRQHV